MIHHKLKWPAFACLVALMAQVPLAHAEYKKVGPDKRSQKLRGRDG